MPLGVSSSRPGLGRPFWTLVAASGASNLADGIFKLALPLLAVHYTRSPALVAGVELVRSLPWLLGALHIGALVDRVDRRRAMVAANAARALLVALPALLISTGGGSLWLLYVMALGTGVAEVVYDTSSQSILPALVPRERLDRANGRLYAVELGAQSFVGPPLAGLLVAVALGLSFATSAAMWVLAIVAMATLRGTFAARRTGPPTTIGADVREGLRFLWERPALRTMAVMVGMGNLAASAVGAILVLFAVGKGSALGLTETQFGFLFAAIAFGGLLGGLVADRIQAALGRARALTVAVVGMAGYVAAPAVTASVAVIAATMFVGGAAIMLWNVITVSFRQRASPDHLLGRVNSAYRLLAWGTQPVGAVLGGLLGEVFGVRSVFAVMGVLSFAMLLPNRRITEETLAAAEHLEPDISGGRPG